MNLSQYLADLVAPLDALLLRGDADPTTRAIMSAVLVLSAPPDESRLADAFERASQAVPRMRQRVVVRGWPLWRAQWVRDDGFTVAGHVRRVGAPGDGSVRAVLAMASETATAPLDPARALWDATLVTGVEGNRAVLLLRAHHAIADGVRALHMMAHLLDFEPDVSAGASTAPEQTASSGPPLDNFMTTAWRAVQSNQQEASWMAHSVLRATVRPVESVAAGAAYANSALRAYGHEGAAPSPLLRERSRARRFLTLEFPLSDLRAAAKAHSATINDLFLAGLLGGMRAYHEVLGEPVTDLPMSFPIDVGGADVQSGNHFSAAVIPGPACEQDPVARLRAVHDLVASRRSEPGLDAPVRLAPLLHRVPTWLAAKALKAYGRRVDLQASNIVGPEFPVYLAGAKVERFYAFGPLPGIPVMAVLVSHEGTCTIGFTIDPAAVTDAETFLACTRASFLELTGA